MANIIDYVRWRGDIPVSQVPIGEVDALILSYLSYMPYDGIVSARYEKDGVTLAEIARQLLACGAQSSCFIDSEKDDRQLLSAIAESGRFGNMRLSGFVSLYDAKEEQQFSAVTFTPETGPAFVAFRGTDGTVIGWKEDFNMSFETEIPSQRDAVRYVEWIVPQLEGKVILGGHSKGGNLAAYAGMFVSDAAREAIECVYNFDGPGFNESIVASPEFARVDMRIHTFVPQTSLFGVLLWHAEPYAVVSSDGVGLLQHNPYTWQLMGGQFVKRERSASSRLAEETLKNWLGDMTPEARRSVIDGVYSVLSVSDGRNIADLFEPRNVLAILRAVGNMDEATRQTIFEAFRLLGNSIRELAPGWLDRTAGDLLQRVRGERELPSGGDE